MSGQLSSAVIFVSVVAIAIAANLAEDHSGGAHNTRKPASIASSKALMLGEFRSAPALKYTQKIHGSLYVKIETVGPAPKVRGDVFVLRGEMRSEDGELSGVSFKWSVPAGVRVVSGAIEGVLPAVASGQPQLVELTLEKTSDQNEQVHLMAKATVGNSQFADVAQFNTDIQEAIDANAASIKAGLEIQAPQTGNALKIFQ